MSRVAIAILALCLVASVNAACTATSAICPEAITTKKIADGAIGFGKLSDKVKAAIDAPGPTGPAGAAGAKGATGDVGPKGATGATGSVSVTTETSTALTGKFDQATEWINCSSGSILTCSCDCGASDGLSTVTYINDGCLCSKCAAGPSKKVSAHPTATITCYE